MSATSKNSVSCRRLVQLDETTCDEAAELFQALASAPSAPEAVARDHLLDDEVQPCTGD